MYYLMVVMVGNPDIIITRVNGNTCGEMGHVGPSSVARVEMFHAQMRAVFAEGLRRGQRVGTFDAERDPDALAAALQVGMLGMMLLAKSRPSADVMKGAAAELMRLLD